MPSPPPQTPPGSETNMHPIPQSDQPTHKGTGKLDGKVAVITGSDSGIGKAVAILFAKEGCDIVISYLSEHTDAQDTKSQVEDLGRQCILISGDIGDEAFCQSIISQATDTFGRIDILVNNAAEQHPQESIEQISSTQLEKTFRTNIFSFFYLTKAALPHMSSTATIINTTSVTAYRGSPELLDYSATKGAIVAFTRSLSHQLARRGIRVNAVAPGPVWTPLITSTFPKEKVDTFGKDVPLARPGQPAEIAPCYLFLASSDSSYITGQVLHPNGGEIING